MGTRWKDGTKGRSRSFLHKEIKKMCFAHNENYTKICCQIPI
ncbi:MAG: hypothetical protein JETT_1313 [Candidatus Jettenia ecosi]|uniref:Uncharacterized protein n=1 Tax=Candidatus Jettenia ecosi TaxID=2494326 RepID=A0A533QD20_9BACT|nr:MAG: hypothetical protein JETT_1313 [Candidatus Jettenia ecosi]